MLITGEIVSNPADSGAQGSKNGRLIGLRRSAITAYADGCAQAARVTGFDTTVTKYNCNEIGCDRPRCARSSDKKNLTRRNTGSCRYVEQGSGTNVAINPHVLGDLIMTTRFILGLSAAAFSLNVALAPVAFAEDKMGKDDAMKKETMSHDSMKKDTMSKDTMSKDGMNKGDAMSKDSMKKDDGMMKK
jgi:pentapeptide MXKDX repeat protein